MSVADVILDLLFSIVLSVVCLAAACPVSRLDFDAVCSRFPYASFFKRIVYSYKVRLVDSLSGTLLHWFSSATGQCSVVSD